MYVNLDTKYALAVPVNVMETAYESMTVIKAMAEIGNPNSITDAAVGALCARAAVRGAFLNVRINAGSYNDKDFVSNIIANGEKIVADAEALEKEIMEIVERKM